ncbi:PaaI family thioesterase [Hufsiella ginkgonis]|uniref:Hotdog fold thioesterase n=1 Tax=Hufsiella ginkgonis TaxID=2695274 RepID=A0A7K1XSJ3_9SPHI|nr:PaaI family thioesterase [Hufsiella ginkgonis]MXV13709.1 hotdog fold thioesterase [Hufsiella ginkgonis]
MENKVTDSLKEQLNQVITRSPSAFMLWLGPVLRAVDEGSLTFEFTVARHMTNPAGTLHGGMTAAIMDDIVGATILSLGRQHFFTTINNAIDYLSPAKEGDVITAKTQVIRAGRQVINVQFELWNLPRKRLLARGYSNALRTEIEVPESFR